MAALAGGGGVGGGCGFERVDCGFLGGGPGGGDGFRGGLLGLDMVLLHSAISWS